MSAAQSLARRLSSAKSVKGSAEFGVGAVAEADGVVLAAGVRDGAGAGGGGQGLPAGVAAAGVTDLGEQCCGPDLPGAGQAGEHIAVRVLA
jgi:hypothetical protein